MTTSRRRGRPAGASPVRENILRSARELFAEVGYERATIRAVAARAQADPASVHHHFGTKRELLAAALALPFEPATVVAPESGGTFDGREFLRRVLEVWEAPETALQMRGLLRMAVADDRIAGAVRDLFTGEVLARLWDRLGPPDAEVRASLIGSQIAGLVLFRFVLEVEPVAGLEADALVDAVAPTIERYADPRVPIGA